MVVVRACLLALAGCASLKNPFPDQTIISPGVKLGYTPGAHHGEGGFTWGFELTIPRKTWQNLHAIVAAGPALNLSWSPQSFQVRAGAEIVSWFAGIEGGPALVSDKRGVHVGFGIGPWVGGIFIVPYLTHTFVMNGQDETDFGSYLKLPICPSCPAGDGHVGHLHFDD